MGIYGQDWASYQSSQPDTTGLSFVFIKVTEGETYENPHWVGQYHWARSQGLVVGLYHYPHMGNSVSTELDYFLSTINTRIGTLPPEDMLCLDWEGYDPANQGVPHARQVAYKDEFLHSLKGRQPHNAAGAYMNADYWNNVDTTGHYGDYLWIAAGSNPGTTGVNVDWLFQQYGETRGVDLDYCHLGSTDELRAWALSFAAIPQEDIVTPQDIQAVAAAVVAAVPAAVWNYEVPDWGLDADGNPKALGTSKEAYWHIVWPDVVTALQAARDQKILASEAAITALVTQLAQTHGVDTATVVKAVQDAIAATTVHVQITGTPTPAPSA